VLDVIGSTVKPTSEIKNGYSLAVEVKASERTSSVALAADSSNVTSTPGSP
jgi:hypothetical protein